MFLLWWMIGIRQERGAMVHPLVVWTWGTSLCSKIIILMSADPRIRLSVVQLDKNRHRSYALICPDDGRVFLLLNIRFCWIGKNEWKVLPQQKKQWESYELWTSMESDGAASFYCGRGIRCCLDFRLFLVCMDRHDFVHESCRSLRPRFLISHVLLSWSKGRDVLL